MNEWNPLLINSVFLLAHFIRRCKLDVGSKSRSKSLHVLIANSYFDSLLLVSSRTWNHHEPPYPTLRDVSHSPSEHHEEKCLPVRDGDSDGMELGRYMLIPSMCISVLRSLIMKNVQHHVPFSDPVNFNGYKCQRKKNIHVPVALNERD